MKSKGYRALRATTAGLALALGGVFAAQSAAACTLTLWNGGTSGGVVAGQPDTDNIARYAGVCAMQVPGGAVSYVQDNSPGGINRIVARFYVLNNLAAGQSAIIYRGFNNTSGAGALFTVRLESNGLVKLIDNASAVEVTQTSSTPWTSIEIDWTQGSGTGALSLSVNGQGPATAGSLNNAGSALQSVRLGNLNSATGTVNFDAYESRRSTPVGRLCVGETTGDNNRTSDDFLEIFDEAASAGLTLSDGQPDFTEDGAITNDDVLGVFDLVANAAGACP